MLPQRVVLLDDVLTTGEHVRACARYRAESGIGVEDVLVIGRTLLERPADMFNIPVEELDS